MAVEIEEVTGGGRRAPARPDPPPVLFLLPLLLTLALLPSALPLPQANPQGVFEIVPSPPNKQQTPPTANFADLGLGSSGTLESGGAVGGDHPGSGLPPPPPGQGLAAPPPPPNLPGKGKT